MTRVSADAPESKTMKELNNTELRQDRTIAALLVEPTVEAAARAADVSDVTIWRWMQRPEFRAKLRDARRAVVEAAVGHLQQASAEAVETLRRNLACGTPSVEVKAATAILDQALKAIELFDVVERVEHLEAQLAPGGETEEG